jgi:hypothetical protein
MPAENNPVLFTGKTFADDRKRSAVMDLTTINTSQ